MTQSASATSKHLPRVGMMATVRNRRGIIVAVQSAPGGADGTLHLVTVEYTDLDGVSEEQLIWEREPNARVIEPHALPNILQDSPMSPREFDALIRASRWNAMTPFLAPDGSSELAHTPISAPFYGAVQVEDFQLVPLLKALRMPRVSLLLADDVGLGKTIEAGLILNELLIRRRIRRVLILCPAALRDQWKQEMQDKFALPFDVVDRDETHKLKRTMGMDANPWRIFPRAIASYYYLRQENVLEEFRAACNPDSSGPNKAKMPWDLLIVDEAHNLMPANFGEDSDLAKMLSLISPWFEHKLFLTATPHNGHTRCFTGLLEQLDASRFQRTSELDELQKQRIEQIVVRRLKTDINELDDERGRPRRFAERQLYSLDLLFTPNEKALTQAFFALRQAIKKIFQYTENRHDKLASEFAVEVLNKRLLSGPIAFADSWLRFLDGMSEDDDVDTRDISAAQRATAQDMDDDLEYETRVGHAARTTGAWLRKLSGSLEAEIEGVTQAIKVLGITRDKYGELTNPADDTRFRKMQQFIDQNLRESGAWRTDERLIIFTEYKTTLDYLVRRLREEYKDKDAVFIRELYGGMQHVDRDTIKKAFNDADNPIRILVATDAASEGLNLQETARLLLHYDIPWNPSRLEQRNGRLDRHGQGRDVRIYHFDSREDVDLLFMGRVVRKVHNIREELGSMGEVFDAAMQRYFTDQESCDRVASDMERAVDSFRLAARESGDWVQSNSERELLDEAAYIEELKTHLDLTPENLAQTLEVAFALNSGLPRFEGPDERGRYKFLHPIPAAWNDLIDDTLRYELNDGAGLGALPGLTFDPEAMLAKVGNRRVFRHSRDTTLMHLGHPIFKQALSQFARARFPNSPGLNATRWIARFGDVPQGAEALILLTVEEVAVNELREPLHHWVRTIRLPVVNGVLESPLPYLAPTDIHCQDVDSLSDAKLGDRARDLWSLIEIDVKTTIGQIEASRTEQLNNVLEERREEMITREEARYDERLKEVKSAMIKSGDKGLNQLQKEIEKQKKRMDNTWLNEAWEREERAKLTSLEDELKRRETHYNSLLDTIKNERDTFVNQVLPKRLSIADKVNIFPVCIELQFAR